MAWFSSSDDSNNQQYSNSPRQCSDCGQMIKPLEDGSLPRHKVYEDEKWAWCYGD